MATYQIEIQQILTGYVHIQAESVAEALRIAEERFVENGEELPEMDDLDDLQLSFDRIL